MPLENVILYSCADCGAENTYRDAAEITFYVGYKKYIITLCQTCLTKRLGDIITPMLEK